VDSLKEFGKAVVTPAFFAIGLISTGLGFAGTSPVGLPSGALFGLGYVTLGTVAVRIWLAESQRARTLAKWIDRLTSEVHGALEVTIKVKRFHLPAQRSRCFGLKFAMRFKNDSDARVTMHVQTNGAKTLLFRDLQTVISQDGPSTT
jgi:hypothetical protein